MNISSESKIVWFANISCNKFPLYEIDVWQNPLYGIASQIQIENLSWTYYAFTHYMCYSEQLIFEDIKFEDWQKSINKVTSQLPYTTGHCLK